jgi:hypothetical protein
VKRWDATTKPIRQPRDSWRGVASSRKAAIMLVASSWKAAPRDVDEAMVCAAGSNSRDCSRSPKRQNTVAVRQHDDQRRAAAGGLADRDVRENGNVVFTLLTTLPEAETLRPLAYPIQLKTHACRGRVGTVLQRLVKLAPPNQDQAQQIPV